MGEGLQNFVKSLDLDAVEWANMHFWYPWDTKSACLPILGHPNSINHNILQSSAHKKFLSRLRLRKIHAKREKILYTKPQ